MTRRLGLLAIAILFTATAALQAQAARGAAGWVLLGTRTVTDRQDHDTIVVTGARGTFKAIRLEVSGHAVDFHRVVVHFANGDDQRLELRNTIPAGGQSRNIDIDGKERVIRSIDFWYDAKTIGRGGKAIVRVRGQR